MRKKGQRLLESKIQIPDIQKNFQNRDRILEKLENADRRLCVLHATIGYGKTVLLSQYARQSDHVCAWYHLDAMDNETVTFIRYLINSLQNAADGFAFEIEPYLGTEEMDLSLLSRDLIMELEDYWAEMQKKKLILVLDDFQVVQNPAILYFLEDLLDHMGDFFVLMAATKGAVPDLFTKYFMRDQGIILDSADLSFSEEEVRKVISRILSGEEAETYTEMIWKNMEGWPAGVMFATLYLRQLGLGGGMNVDWIHISQESMASNYIAYELFKGLPYEIQNFLIRTSIADEMQAELCNEICGINNSGAILKYLFQENIFISHMGGKRGSYRYHSMFRSFLNERVSEELRVEICRIIAEYYMKRQEASVAAKYAMEARAFELLSVIVEKSGLSMFCEGRRKLVEKYLSELGKSGMDLPGEIWFLKAVCAFWNKETEDGQRAIETACEKDDAYLGYKMLYAGLFGDKTTKQTEQLEQACASLRQEGRELPPLPEEKRILVEQIWNRKQEGRENRNGKLLCVSCFGTFRVKFIKTGKEISWRTRKAMELFAYLLDREGRPVERRVLLEHLWPDNAPNNAVAMLHNMIYSIRRELSAEPELEHLIQYRERQYSLDISLIDSDMSAAKTICTLTEQGEKEKLYGYREELLHMQGTYLEEVDMAWCTARRAYFERTFGKAYRVMAEYCREQGRPEEEVVLWRAYMGADRYSEEAVAGLLRCYARMGERSQMKKVYESAQKLFREDLGLEMSDEVTQIYEKGMRKNR